MIEDTEVISKRMDSVYQDDLYIMQLLTNFAYQVSSPGIETQNWTVEKHLTSMKKSTDILIEEI